MPCVEKDCCCRDNIGCNENIGYTNQILNPSVTILESKFEFKSMVLNDIFTLLQNCHLCMHTHDARILIHDILEILEKSPKWSVPFIDDCYYLQFVIISILKTMQKKHRTEEELSHCISILYLIAGVGWKFLNILEYFEQFDADLIVLKCMKQHHEHQGIYSNGCLFLTRWNTYSLEQYTKEGAISLVFNGLKYFQANGDGDKAQPSGLLALCCLIAGHQEHAVIARDCGIIEYIAHQLSDTKMEEDGLMLYYCFVLQAFVACKYRYLYQERMIDSGIIQKLFHYSRITSNNNEILAILNVLMDTLYDLTQCEKTNQFVEVVHCLKGIILYEDIRQDVSEKAYQILHHVIVGYTDDLKDQDSENEDESTGTDTEKI